MMQAYLEGGAIRPVAPPSGVYRTADGYLSVTVVRPQEFSGFCAAMGCENLGTDARYATHEGRIAHAETLWPLFRAQMETRSTAAWAAALAERRIMHEAINSYVDFLAQPHVAATGTVAWVHHPDVDRPLPLPNLIGLPPFAADSARAIAPRLGEHSAAILREHGFSSAEIAALAADGIIGLAASE